MRLRAFREMLGLKQNEFAEHHNFSPTQYTNWETGARRIPIEKAALLEDRYGLSLDFIYLGRVRTLPHNLAVQLADKPLTNSDNSDSETSAS